MGMDWKVIGVARWYDCKLGTMYDAKLSRLTGVPLTTIRRRRIQFDIPTFTIDKAIDRYASCLGNEPDWLIAEKCGTSTFSVRAYRNLRGIKPYVKPSRNREKILPYGHPLAPFTAALQLIPAHDIAKAAQVAVEDVQALCRALDITSPESYPEQGAQRSKAKAARFAHLFGVVPDIAIAKLAGVSRSRIQQMRKDREARHT